MLYCLMRARHTIAHIVVRSYIYEPFYGLFLWNESIENGTMRFAGNEARHSGFNTIE